MSSAGRVAVISGAGAAVPPGMGQEAVWDGFFRAHYRDDPLARRIWGGSGVTRRHGVVDPRVEDVSGWGTAARMRRYIAEAPALGKEAVTAALAEAALDAADVGLFAVATCTGYSTPGPDILLARDVGMSADVQRLLVGHMGCYAALPGLGAVSDFVVARNRPAVLLCLELPSLHVQPAPRPRAGRATEEQVQQMVAHALFGDAAAAVVVLPREVSADPLPPGAATGLTVVDIAAATDATTTDHMTWDVTDLGFRMGLSPRVPDVLARHAGPVVDRLLDAHGLGRADVAGWAVHPGGPRILQVVAEALRIPRSALARSDEVLADYGNCSSATVLLVLDRLRRAGGLPTGSPVVAMAFGPGLTLYAALLRTTAAGGPPPAPPTPLS